MDANKEESDRCIQIAQRYIREGSQSKALKFLQKAQKLCPSSAKINELLKKCGTHDDDDEPAQNGFTNTGNDYSAFDQYESNVRSRFHSSKSQPDFTKQQSTASSESASSSTGSSPTSETSNSNSNRNRSKSRTRTSSTSSTSGAYHRTPSTPQLGADFTEEQLEAVQRVRRCKDYYEMLNVKKDFNEIELKKQYKKLALQFHPDKNRAPGATEAFKAIGNAYAVLCDSEKRQRYDMYGTETPSTTRRRNNFYEHDYSRGFEADMTAEEIFNMFFGYGFSQDVHRRQHYNFQNQQSAPDGEQRNENAASALFLLMPVLILVVMSMFSQFLMPEAAYSFQRTEKYTHERRTGDLSLTYYVKPDFVKQYSGNIYRIDQQIEQDYVQQLKTNCFRERSQRETAMWRARNYGDADLYERAQALKTPSCDRLAEIYT